MSSAWKNDDSSLDFYSSKTKNAYFFFFITQYKACVNVKENTFVKQQTMMGIEFDLLIFRLVERFRGRMQSNRKVARVNILAAQKAVGGKGRRQQKTAHVSLTCTK